MTEKSKDRVINISLGLATALITVVLFLSAAKRQESKDIDDKLNSKVDKAEFVKECGAINARITNVEKVQNETLNEISKAMQQLSTQSASMQTDIAWIKREIDKKGK